jgi:hypothetical protein
VVDPGFHDWGYFSDQDANLWGREILEDPAGQKFREGLNEVEVAAVADVHSQDRDLGIVERVLNGIRPGGLGRIDPQLDINGKPLLDGPLFGSNSDIRDAVNGGKENFVHRNLRMKIENGLVIND